jgi:hypothetical protein
LIESKRDFIVAIDQDQRTPEQTEALAQLVNNIEDLEDKMLQPFKQVLAGADTLTVDGAYSTYNKRLADEAKSHGQMFNVIFGQMSQLLQDAVKQDSSYLTAIASNDPLELYSLTE